MERSLAELASRIGGTVEGDGSVRIRGLAPLEEAGPGELSFYGNPRYRKELAATRASAVLVPPGEPVSRADVVWVRVPSPHLAFARLLSLFHPAARLPPGVHPRAEVHPSARVDPSATVMALAVVEAGAVVGARSVLWPGSYVGEGSRLGEDCVLQPGAVVRERCVLGDRVVLQPGVVVGSDGFGFVFDAAGPAHVKVPQVGTVRIEDDVEVGAGSCIDRATTGETFIGRGTKIDNLVQIAHNVRVGPLSILCAQVGVSGIDASSARGWCSPDRWASWATCWSATGPAWPPGRVFPHDVPPGETVSGAPAVQHALWLRQSAALKRLPELLREVRELRARLAALESRKDES